MLPNNYYYRLDLPNNPLKASPQYDPARSMANVIFPQSRDIISDETISIFESIGLDVKCGICFMRRPSSLNPVRKNQSIIHTDWRYEGEQMVPWYFGVNYEIVPQTRTTMSWWESTAPLKYPKRDPNNINLCSLIYGDILNPVTDKEYTKLESVEISTVPTLVNTSIPHSVNLYGSKDLRISLSIRFNNQVSSWEEGVKLFDKLIIEVKDENVK
jgi:hypothetical protein